MANKALPEALDTLEILVILEAPGIQVQLAQQVEREQLG